MCKKSNDYYVRNRSILTESTYIENLKLVDKITETDNIVLLSQAVSHLFCLMVVINMVQCVIQT